jgi:hypothetical protein
MMDDFDSAYREAVEKETDIRDTSFTPEVPWVVAGQRLRWITPLDYKVLVDSRNDIVFNEEYPRASHVAAFYWFLSFDAKPKAWWRLALARWQFMRKLAPLNAAVLVAAARNYLAENVQDSPGVDGDGTGWRPLPASWLVLLCDSLAREYGWDDDAIIRKPIARLYQYLKIIMARADPSAPTFNPSDSVRNRLMQN